MLGTLCLARVTVALAGADCGVTKRFARLGGAGRGRAKTSLLGGGANPARKIFVIFQNSPYCNDR